MILAISETDTVAISEISDISDIKRLTEISEYIPETVIYNFRDRKGYQSTHQR